MIVLLVGYEGSQKIVKASKYLTSKYLPKDWVILYLNYTGDVNNWAEYLSELLKCFYGKHIIFALDDYLISAPIDVEKYNAALPEIGGDVVCIKLCESTEQEHKEYPVTTQWTIWDREYLITLLSHPEIKNAWQFEMYGSKIFNKICLHRPCLKYFTNSSISARWEGIRLDGLQEHDLKFLKENEYI